MTSTNPYPPKRSCSSLTQDDYNNIFPKCTKRPFIQSSTQSCSGEEKKENHDDEMDDASSFELDLSMCPELSSMRDSMSQMQINDDNDDDETKLGKVDEGDEMQKAAIDVGKFDFYLSVSTTLDCPILDPLFLMHQSGWTRTILWI